MSKFSVCLAFVAGTVIGSCATWLHLKKEYERKTQEEIDSVKEVFGRRRCEEPSACADEPVEEKPATDRDQAIKLTTELGYSKDDDYQPFVENVYVIRPDVFGEYSDYECISLTFYADGTLADDGDEPIDDIEAVVGTDWPDQFDEYEEDVVYVRNDELRCDYEICRDLRTYEEVTGR